MAATSNRWTDINVWLYRVINSCTTISQLMSVKNLIALFKKKYPLKRSNDAMIYIHDNLDLVFNVKYEQINDELIMVSRKAIENSEIAMNIVKQRYNEN